MSILSIRIQFIFQKKANIHVSDNISVIINQCDDPWMWFSVFVTGVPAQLGIKSKKNRQKHQLQSLLHPPGFVCDNLEQGKQIDRQTDL